MRRNAQIFGIIAAVLVADQLSKIYARAELAKLPARDYLGGFFRIEFALNPGAFLSLGAGLSDQTRTLIFVLSVGVFLVGALVYLMRKRDLDKFTTWGLSLLVGGGIGNLIDRVMFGRVTDFLNMGLGSLRTGIFNVADMAVVAGVVLLMLSRPEKKTPAKA